MSKSKPISSSCPSSPISRSPTPPVSLSYSNWPRKRVSHAIPKKSPMVEPIPHVQEPYPSVSANQSAANDASENRPLQENIQNKVPIASPTIQHHVIKGRISPIMVVRKNFSAHQDLASQQLMDRQPIIPSSCPSSPNLASSAIPIGASASAPASTAISTRTARPSFARRTSAPSLLVSALVASHANSREKLSQDTGGPKITDQEKSSPRSSRIPVASLPTISVTTVVENAPEAKLTVSTKNIAKEGQSLRNKSCSAQLRPALKRFSTDPEGSPIQDPDGSSIQRKSVQFETKFERIRLFLEAETPHAVTLSPTRLGPVPKMDAGSIVLPNFPHLTTCYHSKPVSVESVSLSPDGTHILGLIQVQNLAYEKIVRARYTFDCWETAHEVVARYKEPIIPSDSNYRGLDRFEFSVPIPPRLDDSADDDSEDVADMWRTMYMAVQYQVEGTQYWDSNSGENYQINIRQPPPQKSFEEDKGGEEIDQGIFDLSDLGDDDSKENSPDFSSSPRRIPVAGKSIKTLSGSSAIPLRTVKKNLGNRYDFGASLAATVRPRSSPPSFLNSNPMYHRPSSPLSFSSFSSTSTLLSSSSSQIPTSSSKFSSPSFTSSSPNASPSITRPSPRPTIPSFMSSSSSVEAPISSTPWEERARTAAVSYCRPSSPSCDFTSNNPTSYDSSSFPGIPSAWTSYSPSGASSFDAIYSGSPTPQNYHQPYSPLSSPYSSSPPATAIWG